MTNALKERPLFFICGCFSLSSFLCAVFGGVYTLVLLALSFVSFIIALCLSLTEKRKCPAAAVFVALSVMLSCGLSYFFNTMTERSVLSRIGEYEEAVCKVSDVSCSYSYYSAFDGKITSLDGETVSFRARVEISDECAVAAGETVVLSDVRLSAPSADDEKYLDGGTFCVIEAESVSLLSESSGIVSWFRNLSDTFAARFRIMLGAENGGLASAIALGRRSDLPERVASSFTYLGISHLVAVSGLHLSVVIGLLDRLLVRMFRKKWPPYVIDVFLIVFFCLLTGLRPSVLRSGIMLILLLTARLTGAKSDALTSLSVASALIIIFSPYTVTDCGFLLSVLATLGLILFAGSFLPKGEKTPSKLVSALLGSVTATLSALWFTLPVVCFTFRSITPAAIVSNPVFIPFAAIILVLFPFALLFFGTPLQTVFASPLRLVCSAAVTLSEKAASSFPRPFSLGHSFVIPCFLLSAAVLIAVIAFFRGRKRRLLASFAPQSVFAFFFAVCLAVSNASQSGAAVIFLNKNTNDYISLKSENKLLFCDVSDSSWTGMRDCADASLGEYGDTGYDVLVLTHLHTKHISTVPRFIDKYRPSVLLLPIPSDSEEQDVVLSLKSYAEKYGIKSIEYDSRGGETVEFHGVLIRFNPSEEVRGRAHSTLSVDFLLNDKIGYRSVSSLKEEAVPFAVIVGSHGGYTTKKSLSRANLIAISEKTAVSLSIPTEKTDPFVSFTAILH